MHKYIPALQAHTTALDSVELDRERGENQNRFCSLCLTMALKCKHSSGRVV